jgi:hypothetical protein
LWAVCGNLRFYALSDMQKWFGNRLVGSISPVIFVTLDLLQANIPLCRYRYVCVCVKPVGVGLGFSVKPRGVGIPGNLFGG